MSTERAWDVHAPNVEPRNCKYCEAEFYPTHGTQRYCPEHRSNKYARHVSRSKRPRPPKPPKQPKLIERKCFVCKQKFTFESGRGSATRSTCDSCRIIKAIGTSSGIFAAAEGHDLISPDRGMAFKENTWDNEYARIETDFLLEQQEVMRALETNEIMYGRSVTEHHQSPLVMDRLELAIERVNPKKVEEMRSWAQEKLMRPPTVEEVWAAPARTEKEQWVINFMNKGRGG